MPWIKEIELANSVDDLKTSQFFGRTGLATFFWTLDVRIATALERVIQVSNLKKKIFLEE